MFLSLSLTVLLAAIPPELEQVAAKFVEAAGRDDRLGVRGRRPQRHSLGTSYDRILLLDDIDIQSWRALSVEPGDNCVYVNVEMDGTATVSNNGDRVPWPRWWSLQMVKVDGRWVLDTAMMAERRFVEQHWRAGPPALERVLGQHPELDFGSFSIFLAEHASDPSGPPACAIYLWMLDEAAERGDERVLALAYQMLSGHAAEPPVDPAAALDLAEQSLRHAEASGDAQAIADAYYSLGIAHSTAGRVDEAVAALRKTVPYHARAFDPRIVNISLYTASELEIARQNLRAALADAELYQSMVGQKSSRKTRMLAALRLAEIHDKLGNPEISRRYYEQAREHAQAERDPEWQLITTHKIALQELALGDVDGARRSFEEARPFYGYLSNPELVVMNQSALSAIYRNAGNVDEAEAAIAHALTVIDAKAIPPQYIAGVYLERSALRLVQGRPAEALADARLASAKAGSPRADALTAEGRALRLLAKDAAAEEVLRAAIDLVEVELSQLAADETGSAMLLQAKLGPYRELLDLLVEQGCAREAFTVAERMRARSLRETLQHGRVDLSAGLDAEKRQREHELEEAVAVANRKILAANGAANMSALQQERDEARLALRRFRSELYAAHPQLDRRRPEAAPQQELLRPSIAPGELVLELAVLDHATVLFVLRGEDVTVHRIAISKAALEQQIGAFISALEQRDLGYAAHARALYDLLLGPVANEIAEATDVRIVPDGAAWRLPFHALVDGGGKHLVERVSVAYSPSLALAMARSAAPRPAARGTLLAFGDPAVRTETAQATRALFRDVNLGRLPDAASEARAIARLYGNANVRIGADALEAAFKEDAPAYRVLHLAAHSIVDDRAPMFSSIVLSSSGKNPLEDGLLEAREIAGLDLHAELAVLSACETARGAVTAGEGVIGLSWAFLAAGVPTTVVSQWKVGSASTAELMIEFHRRLRGGRKAAEALRTAMLELRRDPRWRHPFYWAPFAVIENSGIPSERQ